MAELHSVSTRMNDSLSLRGEYMVKKLFLVCSVLAAAGFWVFGGGAASAAYPPNPTSVALAAGNMAPATGDSVSVAVSVLDASGSPVADVSCSFTIVSQPGTDASLSPNGGRTNAQGVASTTLKVGSNPGTIVVGANCGNVTGIVSVVASAAAAPPASIPGGPSTGPTLPSSGTGAGSSSLPKTLILASLALLALSGSSAWFYVVARRNVSR